MIKGWETGRIFPIHKSGDEGEVNNYRGVSLLDGGHKLLTKIMANRIRNWSEKNHIFKEMQAGFRIKRGAKDHIFTLNSIIANKLNMEGGKLFLAFIDYKWHSVK